MSRLKQVSIVDWKYLSPKEDEIEGEVEVVPVWARDVARTPVGGGVGVVVLQVAEEG